MNFDAEHRRYVCRCEEALKNAVSNCFQPGSEVSRAAEYALMGGGKRVRGVLVLAVCDMLGGNAEAAASFAAAIEMVHAFSLVHDDLPCMDDDDLRRGRPATHIAFGEATALLAGDLLALQPFEVIAGAPTDAGNALLAMRLLAQAAGAKGMLYGQELDLMYEEQAAGEEELALVQRFKTGALVRAATLLGAAAAGCEPALVPAVAAYAEKLGLVFQIVDDILDVEGNEAVLGKPVNSDKEQGKTTMVTLLGLDAARQRAATLTTRAITELRQNYSVKAKFLCEYAQRLLERVR